MPRSIASHTAVTSWKPKAKTTASIHAWYEFLVWMLPNIHKFFRDQRFMLGHRIEDLILEIMQLLIRARFTQDRQGLLAESSTESGLAARPTFDCSRSITTAAPAQDFAPANG